MIYTSTISSDWPGKEWLEAIAEEEIKEITGDIFRACVKFSPVWTGSFRASWRTALNGADESVTNGGSKEAPLRGATFKWPTGFKLGDLVVISNNQPYADLIEYAAWSKQSPYGVLRVAIASVEGL